MIEKLVLPMMVGSAAALSATVWAQNLPDAGRTIQELALPLETPLPSDLELKFPQTSDRSTTGGTRVVLNAVRFEGNDSISPEELLVALGEFKGQSHNLNELEALARKVTRHYQEKGFPFVRSLLPEQSLATGELTIRVVEGRYGLVSVTGDEAIAPKALPFVAPLKRGRVIEARELERALLLIGDQPGMRLVPVIRPGKAVGEGDLEVSVRQDEHLSAEVGADNHGNRYTGQYRVKSDLKIQSPFTFGDQVHIHLIYTDEHLRMGSVYYHFPIGAHGARAHIGYAQTDYSLGKEFSELDASGFAKIASVGVSYSLIRSKASNWTVFASYEYKNLEDRYGINNSNNKKSSWSIPVKLQFDHRDVLGGGGITYGAATWTSGRMHLGAELKGADLGGMDGAFNKFNLELARIQSLPGQFQAYGKWAAQWTSNNLDSSEDFGIGGVNAVRAYPSGEGYGDTGWLAQTELRYLGLPFTPYLFWDEGKVKINREPWPLAGPNNQRHLASMGLGSRFSWGQWNTGVSLAWRQKGGKTVSDSRDSNPRAWVSVTRKF